MRVSHGRYYGQRIATCFKARVYRSFQKLAVSVVLGQNRRLNNSCFLLVELVRIIIWSPYNIASFSGITTYPHQRDKGKYQQLFQQPKRP
jgi:uncharacterized membrane protein YoaT (DUF817 family)